MNTLANVIAAVGSLITAVGSFILAIRMGTVHRVVNQRTTDLLARIEQLTETVQQDGTTIPPDPSLQEARHGS